MNIIKMRPPRIAMGLTAIATVLHFVPRIWVPHIWDELSFSILWLGIPLSLTGFSIIMWAWWIFQKRDVAVCPIAKTERLITQGPYRLTRNPMYLGMVLMLLGLALCVGTPPFYLSAITFFAIINFIFSPYEENKLVNSFGDEYLIYKNRVRRWI